MKKKTTKPRLQKNSLAIAVSVSLSKDHAKKLDKITRLWKTNRSGAIREMINLVDVSWLS